MRLGLHQIAWVVVATLAAGPLLAQEEREFSGHRLEMHHSFPAWGDSLTLVVDGLSSADPATITLAEAVKAPPSLVAYLEQQSLASWSADGALVSWWRPDGGGQISLSVPLVHSEDAGKEIYLQVSALDGRVSDVVHLHVVPPILVVPTSEGLMRIDLRNGDIVNPPLGDETRLLGLGTSSTGTRTYALREKGRLESYETSQFGNAAPAIRQLDFNCTELAGAVGAGPAFALSHTESRETPRRGKVIFLQGEEEVLALESMGQAVTGRRWAVTPDGLTAFVAEDHQLVRVLHLASRAAVGLFTVGQIGDSEIADMVLDDGQLYVVTRSAGGRPGSLTVVGVETGEIKVTGLEIDPVRLVALGEQQTLIVPFAEVSATGDVLESTNRLQWAQDGVVGRAIIATGAILDATHADGGVVVLQDVDGVRRVDWVDGQGAIESLAGSLPRVSRLASAGLETVILLGDPEGNLWALDVDQGTVKKIEVGVVDTLGSVHSLP